MKYTLSRFYDDQGNAPYTQWIKGLKDLKAITRIDTRLDRAEEGNFGDHKYLRDGIWAMRIDYGPGYRLYYAFEQKEMVLLLVGGDKKSQDDDITKAVSNWKIYQSRGRR